MIPPIQLQSGQLVKGPHLPFEHLLNEYQCNFTVAENVPAYFVMNSQAVSLHTNIRKKLAVKINERKEQVKGWSRIRPLLRSPEGVCSSFQYTL